MSTNMAAPVRIINFTVLLGVFGVETNIYGVFKENLSTGWEILIPVTL
jgi:hypothetical protein